MKLLYKWKLLKLFQQLLLKLLKNKNDQKDSDKCISQKYKYNNINKCDKVCYIYPSYLGLRSEL
jgi:hypothetical protein